MVRHRRVPLLSTLVRGVGARRQAANWPAFYPDWLNEGLEARFGLRERWESRYAARAAAGEHPVRPVAYHSFGDVVWESQFRCFDAEQTRAPMEVRYPFVDLRLLRYMLAVPPVPWCRVKYLLRRSMVGLLPDQVLRRPKAAVEDQSGFPPKLDGSSCSPMLARFVDVDRLASGSGATQTCSSRFALWYAWSLSEWLQQLAGSVPQHTKENQHEASLTGVV
jgi:asparagine synthase (glutamine-hydrolysing)